MSVLYHQEPLFAFSKVCSKCGIEKSLEEFPSRKDSKDGRMGFCRKCENDYRHQQAQSKPIPEKKICPDCSIEYDNPIQAFGWNRYNVDGLMRICKTCNGNYRRTHYHAHPEIHATPEYYRERYATDPPYREKHNAGIERWRNAHPLKGREYTQNRRARKKETATGPISYVAILEQYGYHCHICDKPIDPTIKKGRARLTFDHVKPLAGEGERKGTHTQDNLKPAHQICNRRKGVRLLEELIPMDKRGPDC